MKFLRTRAQLFDAQLFQDDPYITFFKPSPPFVALLSSCWSMRSTDRASLRFSTSKSEARCLSLAGFLFLNGRFVRRGSSLLDADVRRRETNHVEIPAWINALIRWIFSHSTFHVRALRIRFHRFYLSRISFRVLVRVSESATRKDPLVLSFRAATRTLRLNHVAVLTRLDSSRRSEMRI